MKDIRFQEIAEINPDCYRANIPHYYARENVKTPKIAIPRCKGLGERVLKEEGRYGR